MLECTTQIQRETSHNSSRDVSRRKRKQQQLDNEAHSIAHLSERVIDPSLSRLARAVVVARRRQQQQLTDRPHNPHDTTHARAPPRGSEDTNEIAMQSAPPPFAVAPHALEQAYKAIRTTPPEPKDLEQSAKLQQFMDETFPTECDANITRRSMILAELRSIFREWVKQVRRPCAFIAVDSQKRI